MTAPVFAAAFLELKAEKQMAHRGHVISGGPLKSVAFSPDGKSIVSGASDDSINVWDAGVSTDTLQPLANT